MKALFFGATATKLYGVYHPPKAGVGGASGVLICNPGGHEYLYAHRTLRQLADLLAQRGYHVLRFDYFATGDSAGGTEDGTAEQWIADIHTAARELRDLSGRDAVSLLGLRLGALLAACAGVSEAQDLVLWDPVIRGRDYVRQLQEAHRRLLGDRLRSSVGTVSTSRTSEQLLGFPCPATLRNSLERLDLLEEERLARRVVLVGCEGETTELRRHLEQATASFAYHAMLEASRWYAPAENQAVVHPPGTLELLLETLPDGGQ